MSYYYETILEYWRAGEIEKAVEYLNQWGEEGHLSSEEIESLTKILPDEFEHLSERVQERLKDLSHMFSAYSMIKKKADWSDDYISKHFGIAKEEVQNIRNRVAASKETREKIIHALIESYAARSGK